MIKPLIWSINIPLVNGAWVNLFTQVIGPNHIDPLSLAKAFYYRAYFNMGVIGDILELVGLPRETLELMMGVEVAGPEKPRFKPSPKTYRLLPRIIKFAVQMLLKSDDIEQFPARMKAKYLEFQEIRIDELDEQAILMYIDQLYSLNQETAYYNIITPLLMQTYTAIMKKQLEQVGVDFAEFDLTFGLDDLHEVDPNYQLEKLAGLYNQLDANQKKQYDEATYIEFIDMPGWESLKQGVNQFIEDFGHLSDSGNDFSYKPWRENPDLILKMIKTNAEITHDLQNKPNIQDIDAGFLSGILLKIIHHKARQYFLFREQIGSLYTFGYGLFRKYFLALGERFKVRGVLDDKEDIFYLYIDEIRRFISDSDQQSSFAGIISERKQQMENFRNIIPPTIIYGDEPLPVEEVSGTILEGTPTSRGYYQGPAKIVNGIEDFERIQEGDVLVVPYSDVGWTPMYVKAGAVVAESGGMLSHSSIVAREYGIPAVVSVPGACQLLSGKVLTVDGYQGKVTIHDETVEKS
jgi:pyruvate,water dikinase